MVEGEAEQEMDCFCERDLAQLPTCPGDEAEAILCAVAYEQAEMAQMLKVLCCKLCKSVKWLPNTGEEFANANEAITNANKIETDVATLIEALAKKEDAIASKINATAKLQQS